MHRLSHFFSLESIKLSLSAIDEEAAPQEIVNSLRHDHRISNWQEFSQAITGCPAVPIEIDEKRSMIIHHVRTNTVRDLVITAGCSQNGVRYQKSNSLVFLIFVIIIPHALNNDYLRAMGVIARLCEDPIFFNQLLSSTTPKEFIKLLTHKN